MSVWNTSTPAGSDLLSQGDDKIREMKVAIQEALRAGEVAGDNIEGVEAIFPGASPSTAPVYRYRGLKDTTGNRPTAGQYGLFFDTTRNVLQRDNGTSWDDVGAVIPSGTKMVFYQASAPVGWTAVALNDKFLRVVTAGGTGGSTGGTVAASTSLNHSHTVPTHSHTTGAHVLSISEIPSHTHTIAWIDEGVTTASGFGPYSTNALNVTAHTENTGSAGSGNSHSHGDTGTGNLTSTDTNTFGAFAYADIIVCSKD